ncbi:MAG TPA: malectin domain-containing carbohydrate-binding protein [Bryobacteraceae bacterium]|nr:malectin domain-containing carbohydrate-binding protein [Bryobacteraceae bacterium]
MIQGDQPPWAEERRELAAVLSSPGFARSTRMEKLLSYLCERYFAGESDQIKEYNIGVEALGRRETFDPTDDAIARVEVHRLRRKLREYYEGDGAKHPLRISIPTGSYAPAFVRVPSAEVPGAGSSGALTIDSERVVALPPAVYSAIPAASAQLPAASPAPAPLQRFRRARVTALVLAVLGVTVFAVVPLLSRSGATKVKAMDPATAAPIAGVAQGSDILILCGQTRQHVDKLGRTWGPDRYFQGGDTFDVQRQYFARSEDATLFQHGRSGKFFSYDIPLKPGSWELHLYFSETNYGPGTSQGGGETSRMFNVDANGVSLLTGFDILNDAAGPFVADERVFRDIGPGPDGYLHLKFTGLLDAAQVNAISLVPAPAHRVNPVRMIVQDVSYTDSKGRVWSSDNYFVGGRKPYRTPVIRDTPDPQLFDNERFGNFSYSIPVAQGTYEVNVYAAETYWGPETAPDGAIGKRIFDIYCNGIALGRHVDIFRMAGFSRALVLHYPGLRPNAQGKLLLSFVPEVNYATISALEILNTGD